MIQEEDRIKMSFGFAADVVKQLIALSTAIITLCVALTDKLFSSQAIKSNSTLLLIALGLFVLSILFGLLCMMAISGTLGKPGSIENPIKEPGTGDDKVTQQKEKNAAPQDPNQGTIYQSNISKLMKIQIFFFLVGIILSVTFLTFSSCSKTKGDYKHSLTSIDCGKPTRVVRISNYAIIDSVKVDTLSLGVDCHDAK